MENLNQSVSTKSVRTELFIVSLIALYFEMVVIRWLSSEVRAFSIYKNFPLIACYVGLGYGFMNQSKNNRLFKFFPLALLILMALIASADWTGLTYAMTPSMRFQHVWVDGTHPPNEAMHSTELYIAFSLFAFFFLVGLVAFIFACVGEKIGSLFDENKPLDSYLTNLLGSAAGILSYSVLSYLCTPPIVWTAIGMVPVLWCFRKQKIAIAVIIVGTILLGLIPGRGLTAEKPDPNCVTMWSPYYRFDVSPFYYEEGGKSILIGHTVSVNKAFFQQPLNLSHNLLQTLGKDSQLQKFLVSQYDMPYLFLHPEKVLVLGCGTGNDVAAALRNGAQKVVGVEIDPLMIKLGKQIHPEHPYDSPKVETVINDARAFLRQSDYKADLILTGLLDSHTVAGNSLSVRLDDYVYTVNGMRDAMSHLNPDGVYTISFCAPQDFIIKRLLNNLKAATNNDPARKPLVLVMEGSNIYHIFTPVTPALQNKLADLKKLGFKEMTFDKLDEVRESTDDWPYLYLAPALFDPIYLAINAILVAFAWLACGSKIRRNVSAKRWHLFFMGSAFLLLELAVIDRLALTFGTTWFVNSFCVFAILGAIILSNMLIIRNPKLFVPKVLYAALFVSLIALYFVPIENLSSLPFVLSASISGILSAIPIFLAGLIFSGAYSREKEPSTGLAFNIFGAVIGGLMEYAAIYTGIKALLLIALGFYVLSLVFWTVSKDSVASD